MFGIPNKVTHRHGREEFSSDSDNIVRSYLGVRIKHGIGLTLGLNILSHVWLFAWIGLVRTKFKFSP